MNAIDHDGGLPLGALREIGESLIGLTTRPGSHDEEWELQLAAMHAHLTARRAGLRARLAPAAA